MMKFDCLILAGDKDSSYNIKGENKALLKIKDVPLIVYILNTLEKVKFINKIYIVGPKQKLDEAVDKHAVHLKEGKIGAILEQKNTIFENFWHAFDATFGAQKVTDAFKRSKEYQEKCILVMSGDIPLVTVREIEYFISRCDRDQYDYFLGLTPEQDLNHFYPSNKKPGIKMAYVHFKEDLYRGNNLHFIRPGKIGNSFFTQKVYNHRYQKKISNIIKIMREVSKCNVGLGWIGYYLILQLAQFFSIYNLGFLANIFRYFAPIKTAERYASLLLKARFTSVRVPYAGAALDIDNERNYEAMVVMFDAWREYLLRSEKHP